MCHVLHDLVPFVQFKKREKHEYRTVIFSKVIGYLFKVNNKNTRCFFQILN